MQRHVPVLLSGSGRGVGGSEDSLDAAFLSTKVVGGFVGCMVALYATSDGQSSGTEAAYDWFEYAHRDDVYRQFPAGVMREEDAEKCAPPILTRGIGVSTDDVACGIPDDEFGFEDYPFHREGF